MENLLVLILLYDLASSERHSLKIFLYGNSGLPNLPEISGAVMVDGVLVANADSNTSKVEPKLDWMKKFAEENPGTLKLYERELDTFNKMFIDAIYQLMLHLNQTGGVHILQRVNGCEWDDETEEAAGFNRYGYDGEDLMELDMKMMKWVVQNSNAQSIRVETDEPSILMTDYITVCPEMLKTLLNYGREFLQKKERPSVSLLQKTPSSPVSCFATGFFPDRALIFWRKDGEELYEDVEMGELLPNHDGTFQISVDLDVSSVSDDKWESYDCVFHFSGVTDDIIITKLDREAMRTNWVSPSEFPAAAVIGGVVGGLVLLGAAAGILWMWKKTGFHLVPQAAMELHPPNHTNTSVSPP